MSLHYILMFQHYKIMFEFYFVYTVQVSKKWSCRVMDRLPGRWKTRVYYVGVSRN